KSVSTSLITTDGVLIGALTKLRPANAGDGGRERRSEESLQSRSLVDCTTFIDSQPDRIWAD
ncbi:MAG TPA: hypothetical protein VKN76_17815, partial [Kiloniellaceae bacterium]|nr:hypothetical protein [Kiloniellaceae bacterium]